jgi:DNA polymerase-3 subunit delta'
MIYPWLTEVEREFSERLEQGRLPHALLLSGPRGTGKTGLAESFAAGLMCQENGYPACGRCRSCQLLASGAHPDRQLITFEENPRTGEPRKELVVGQVRRLIASMYLTNTISPRKLALVHPAEAMNANAANALLKTLEEPPGEAVLILVSHDTARLPATIRSRCQNLHVRQPEREASLNWLCSEQGLAQDEASAALYAAAGSPLEALNMFRSGMTDQYLQLMSTLEDLRSGRAGTGASMAALMEIAPDVLWSWISLHAAGELKEVGPAHPVAREMAMLQLIADKNRKLISTPVRKDFLLQDWLIQWSQLGA